MCQLKDLADMGSEDPTLKVKQKIDTILNLIGINLIFKETKKYKTKNMLLITEESKDSQYVPVRDLKVGDIVRIRSKEQILQTLNKENKLDGCFFMNEMWQYCGSRQKVLKRVEYFFDERAAKLYKARHIVLLEGVHCSGKQGSVVPRCDRNCYIFWKEDWLEKTD